MKRKRPEEDSRSQERGSDSQPKNHQSNINSDFSPLIPTVQKTEQQLSSGSHETIQHDLQDQDDSDVLVEIQRRQDHLKKQDQHLTALLQNAQLERAVFLQASQIIDQQILEAQKRI